MIFINDNNLLWFVSGFENGNFFFLSRSRLQRRLSGPDLISWLDGRLLRWKRGGWGQTPSKIKERWVFFSSSNWIKVTKNWWTNSKVTSNAWQMADIAFGDFYGKYIFKVNKKAPSSSV